MTNITEQHIFFLDDDPAVRKVVRRILEGSGIKVSCFSDPATCMAKLRSQKCSLLITDLKMPEKDGIEVLKEVKRLTPWIPVLMMSGYGDIPTAIRAIKAGAVDFIEKPLNKTSFIRKITSMLPEIDSTNTYLGKPLTQAEINVLGLVIQGKSSKDIARMFHRSKRTIEGHRSHLMRKLNAENLIDLVNRVASLGLIDMTITPKLLRATKIPRTVRK